MARRAALAVLVLLPLVARAERVTTPELDAERDQLIDKIARGVEVEASVQRFAVLVKSRDARVATSAAAIERERRAAEERRTYLDAYKKTADYEIGWRCTLSVDPANPAPSDEGRWRVDWGRVTKKDALRLAPRNELDDGEPATLYEITGVARKYLWLETETSRKTPHLEAAKGDLVVICDAGSGLDKRLPGALAQEKVQRSGYAAKIAAVPLIAKKAKWNPRHITHTKFFWAIREVKWKYPPEEFVLSALEIKEALGPNQWKVDASDSSDWVLEVPPTLARRELIVPGRHVWAILGRAHFDKALKKLVLVAEDLEARYIVEK